MEEKLFECASDENKEFYFFDPVHQTHNNENGLAWMKKGKQGTKTVLSNTGRRRLNIVSALNALRLETETFITESNCNKELILLFLKSLRERHSSVVKIYLVLDNAGYNRAYEVQEYAMNNNIELLYLPPYSPNMNIIERLWKFFKKKIMKNKYYVNFLDFENAVVSFFENITDFESELFELLSLNFQIIKAN